MIHSTAIVHPKANVAPSCEVGPFCVIGEHVTLGENCKLLSHVVIDGHTTLGRENQVFPFASLGLKTQDVAPFMIVEGNPAQTRTINKIGLERHGFSNEAQTALRQAYKILFREELSVPNALAKIEKELPQLPEVQHLVQFIRASERGI